MRTARVSKHRARRRASLVAATCLLAAIGVAGPPAVAQEPGVVYEPGSPSGKEYAIPLEEARTDAGGAIPGSRETRAFGIGISPRGDRPGASRSGGAREGARRGASRGEAGATGSRSSGVDSRDLRERLADAEGAGGPAFWTLAPLLLVLLPGLLLGLLLARRGNQRPATPAT